MIQRIGLCCPRPFHQRGRRQCTRFYPTVLIRTATWMCAALGLGMIVSPHLFAGDDGKTAPVRPAEPSILPTLTSSTRNADLSQAGTSNVDSASVALIQDSMVVLCDASSDDGDSFPRRIEVSTTDPVDAKDLEPISQRARDSCTRSTAMREDGCEPEACEPEACEPEACEPEACHPIGCEPLKCRRCVCRTSIMDRLKRISRAGSEWSGGGLCGRCGGCRGCKKCHTSCHRHCSHHHRTPPPGDMVPHIPYETWRTYYYFRPYQAVHVVHDQTAISAQTRAIGQPYSNAGLMRLNDQFADRFGNDGTSLEFADGTRASDPFVSDPNRTSERHPVDGREGSRPSLELMPYEPAVPSERSSGRSLAPSRERADPPVPMSLQQPVGKAKSQAKIDLFDSSTMERDDSAPLGL